MKTTTTVLTLLALSGAYCMAANPGDPATNGLTPRTATFYVNNFGSTHFNGTNINNYNCSAGTVGINSLTNVIIGWMDNRPTTGTGITNNRLSLLSWGSAWVVYNKDGTQLSLPGTITNGGGPLFTVPMIGVTPGDSNSVSTTYRSFFRADGVPVGGRYAKDTKIKANLFGPGFAMLATSFPITNNPNAGSLPYLETEAGLGWEIPSLLAINNDNNGLGGYGSGQSGQFPAVQLLNNDMTPDGYRTGGTDANMEPLGIVRNADVDYLANGNTVIASHSQQPDDRALTGQGGGNTPVYRVLNSAGVEIKTYSPVIQTPGYSGELWHGIGVTSNGFAIKSRTDAAGARLEPVPMEKGLVVVDANCG